MAKNDDLILRGKALEDLRDIKEMLVAAGDPFLASVMHRAISCIESQPSVEAAEVARGHWVIDKEHLRATCSECGKTLRFSDEMQIAFLHDEERFCYYCGARMDEEEMKICGTWLI